MVSNVAQAVQSAVQNADRYYKVMGSEASKDPITMANAFKVWSPHHNFCRCKVPRPSAACL